MIRIVRDRCDERGVPIRPAAVWFSLAEDWSAIARAERGAHEAERDVYHHDEVHAALEKLCEGKCAYCEAPAPASSSWDVEHYRPKGRVAERPDHPGYYWLTYDWDNLLLACEFCNRRKADRPTWEEPRRRGPGGKLDRFPLADESTRAMTPDADLAREARLLVDPTRDDPEAHVTFDVTGFAVPVGRSAMGRTSIDVYHLNRRRLRDSRRVQVGVALGLLERLVQDDRYEVGEALDLIVDILGEPSIPWAGMARAIRRDPAAFGLEVAPAG